MSDLERAQLAELLCTHSLREGRFELASGEVSDIYVDVKATSLTGRGADLIGGLFCDIITSLVPRPKAIGGLTLGADPLVTAAALNAFHRGLDLDAIIVRKQIKSHGTSQAVEAPPTLDAGDAVVAVDDVVTTGASTLAVIASMRKAGFVVDHALCVVDRQAQGAQALLAEGVTLHSLFTLQELRER